MAKQVRRQSFLAAASEKVLYVGEMSSEGGEGSCASRIAKTSEIDEVDNEPIFCKILGHLRVIGEVPL